MSVLKIGVVDYGVGNLGSVYRSLHTLGYRCCISRHPDSLDETDLLLLPGVGAFPTAMSALHRYNLVEYLRHQARQGRPILGICLGMQLLADSSTEHQLTAGLGLIPGKVTEMTGTRWHIGWNTFEVLHRDELLQASDGQAMYFNHSFAFESPPEYQIGLARLDKPFAAAVRRGNVYGLQFHPEKSQLAGRQLLSRLIEGLCRA